MTKTRLWLLATGLAVAVILAGGWFLAVSPKHAQAIDIHTQAITAEQQVQTIKGQLAALKKAQLTLPTKQAELANLEQRIPAPDPQLPSLIRSLTKAAAGAHVRLISISPGQPTPLTPSPASTAKGAAAAATSSINGISVHLKVFGKYAEVTRFLNSLEGIKRAFLVQQFTVTGPQAVAASAPAAS